MISITDLFRCDALFPVPLNFLKALTTSIMDEVSEETFEKYFVFAVIWSFAGTLNHEDQEPFSDWWRKTFESRITWPFTGTVS